MSNYILYRAPYEAATSVGAILADAGDAVKVQDPDTGAILYVPYAWIAFNVCA